MQGPITVVPSRYRESSVQSSDRFHVRFICPPTVVYGAGMLTNFVIGQTLSTSVKLQATAMMELLPMAGEVSTHTGLPDTPAEDPERLEPSSAPRLEHLLLHSNLLLNLQLQ